MTTVLNRLELALLDPSNAQLNFYLEDASDEEIRRHIKEIQDRAALSTDSGKLRMELLEVLNR